MVNFCHYHNIFFLLKCFKYVGGCGGVLVLGVWCGHTASGDITVNQSPVMSPLTATHPHFHYLHVY